MSYIIIWRATHRDPHIEINAHSFMEIFDNKEDAIDYAQETVLTSPGDNHYFDYEIFKELDEL